VLGVEVNACRRRRFVFREAHRRHDVEAEVPSALHRGALSRLECKRRRRSACLNPELLQDPLDVVPDGCDR